MRENLTRSRANAATLTARRRIAGAGLVGLGILGFWAMKVVGAW